MASDDGYTYFGDVVYVKDPEQRSEHPRILFESKSKGVTFKFRWSSTHARTEVESYKCIVCKKTVRVRKGRFVTDNPELVDHPGRCIAKGRAPGSGARAAERADADAVSGHQALGSDSDSRELSASHQRGSKSTERLQEEAARDPPLAVVLSSRSVDTVKSAARTTRKHLPGQNLGELIFKDEERPFYNIPWMLVLTREDISRLERRAGIEAYLSDRIVQFYLTYVAAKSAVRTVVVSPQFTGFNHQVGDGSSASLTTTGARRDFLLVLIPIQRATHWTMAICDMRMPEGPAVYYFDPLNRPLTDEIRNVIEAALWTVHLGGQHLRADIIIALACNAPAYAGAEGANEGNLANSETELTA